MTTQHTPGPWGVLDEPGHPPLITAWDDVDGSTEDIAEVFEQTTRSFANARLIAAAPDLLAALQEARDYLADLLNSKDDEVIDNLINNGEEVEFRLSAAIAKATQQPSTQTRNDHENNVRP